MSYSHPGVIGVANDSISSVRVGQDAQALLCRDSGFGGDCERFTASDSNFGNDRIGHDSISSAKSSREASGNACMGLMK